MIGGIVSGIGSVVGGILGYKGQKDTNRTNQDISQEQMAFQERMANSAQDFSERMVNQAHDYQTEMSNTAYQRAMSDMKAAGLNPILAYSQGGASTPLGQMAPGVSAVGAGIPAQNPHAATPQVMSGATTAAVDVMQKQEQIKLTKEETDRVLEAANKLRAEYGLTRQQTQHLIQVTRNLYEQNKKIQAETSGIEADNVQREMIADFLNGAEFAGIAKYLGLSPSVLGGFLKMFLMNARKK